MTLVDRVSVFVLLINVVRFQALLGFTNKRLGLSYNTIGFIHSLALLNSCMSSQHAFTLL